LNQGGGGDREGQGSQRKGDRKCNIWEVGKEGAESGIPNRRGKWGKQKVVEYLEMEKAGEAGNRITGNPHFPATIEIDGNFLRGWKTKQIH